MILIRRMICGIFISGKHTDLSRHSSSIGPRTPPAPAPAPASAPPLSRMGQSAL